MFVPNSVVVVEGPLSMEGHVIVVGEEVTG